MVLFAQPKLKVGIIPDGNRRYSFTEGHKQGIENMKRLIEHVSKNHPEIESLTLYAMSKDNLENRCPMEINALWRMFEENLSELEGKNFEVRFIGDFAKYPDSFLEKINELKIGTELRINILLNYNGEDIGEDLDLVIRTGGRFRLSGFAMPNLKYCNLYFTTTLFPDFSIEEFEEVLAWNENEKQNFGK